MWLLAIPGTLPLVCVGRCTVQSVVVCTVSIDGSHRHHLIQLVEIKGDCTFSLVQLSVRLSLPSVSVYQYLFSFV